ncbi:pentatricopeptide repeat-containing protein At4g17616 [Telopea speciosissima]|uniref:pentatricopeptide repeat-containing protein At4g17616 n=1 Tax=Telopea speciosissima TaxID=54955 RepID=UPI001CC6E83C|nr:pentatricopeptide repeat-containing protein At4g17616 [Telopea speciosissima]XP_043716125.1 pentatricopeptide repeat-containing protein At4g17616 [Telopea speciosissima]XP_043716126.1 pentatricopeptide repeat-containing protein At4g17616 [Telopea speciosissima]
MKMTLTMIRVLLMHHCFSKNSSLGACFVSVIGHSVARSTFAGESSLNPKFPEFLVSSISHKLSPTPRFQQFSAATEPHRILWKGSSNALLLDKLQTALKDHRVDEAWEAFNDFKGLYGFPKYSLVNQLVIELSYSSDSHWLRKAYDLVLLIVNEKPDLLHHDFLTRLALSLVRAQMPIPASTILRLIMEKYKLLSMDLWKTIFIHMVKTDVGTCIASNILAEICECFLHRKVDHNVKSFKCSSLMKPDTMIFNLVLDACVRFRSMLKAQQVIELMPQVGAVADAHSIVIIAQIHEMNGQKDELKKFRHLVDGVSVPLLHHYRQFYDSLLSLHFKFDDIDAASGLVLDLSRHPRSSHRKDLQKPCVVSIGSGNPRMGLRMQVEPELLQKNFVCGVDSQPELVNFMDGRLVLSNKALAKLIIGFKRDGKVGELSVLLVNIQTELGLSQEAGLSSEVINACVQLGWLETAHDILDDMEQAGKPVGSVTYFSLLRSYCREDMLKEGKGLVRQMRKAGLLTDLPDEEVISTCLPEESGMYLFDFKPASLVEKSGLAESLTRELRKEEKATFSLVYKIDSSIYFFCKAKMMEDALKAYRRMQERNLQPTVHTFFNLINGYSSLGMYREITILWGDIRRRLHSGDLEVNRDLQELLLWNFIRGGYFERLMEVISYMIQHGMYIDKWKYKREFLKFHKGLYRNLKASKAKTEAQIKRLEHVSAFRKWAGID